MRRRKLFVALALALVATAIAVPVYATHSDKAPVQATVTPAFLSVTFTAQHVAYGDVDLSITGAVPSGQAGRMGVLYISPSSRSCDILPRIVVR